MSSPQFSVAEVHEAIAASRPDDVCLVYRDRRLTWGELTNRTGHELTGLLATFTVNGAATVYRSERLAVEETVVVAVAIPGATEVGQLTLDWTAK